MALGHSLMSISRYQKLFGIGPIGMLASLAALGILWLLDRSLGRLELLNHPEPIRMIGAGLLAIWLCWHIWCIRTIRRWWVHSQLCTTGPYRYVRHPIYAGASLLASLSISLMFNSWIVLLLPVFMFAIYSFLVRKEEAMMTAVFGEEYQRYAAKTGRLFPRIFS
jgi:protein-S-isoprenylcysteine O-methyltransferase Ste14